MENKYGISQVANDNREIYIYIYIYIDTHRYICMLD